MKTSFARRMSKVRRSFIREILKVTEEPETISFAGGLPNPHYFPVEDVAAATAKVLANEGAAALQYSTTEGYLPLREYIAGRYLKNHGIRVSPAEILITNGSQQGLDLVAKVLIDQGDRVLMERPGYLGAIQALEFYEPEFETVELGENGVHLDEFAEIIRHSRPKLYYAVPNFQNPSGVTYSRENREGVARIIADSETILVEDDPYGELRFMGENLPPIKSYLRKSILLGSFSKIVAPGLRMGWICAPPEIMEKLVTAKQAADLHSNYFTQRVLYQYLTDHDIDIHIATIRSAYKRQRDSMVNAIREFFPPEVHCTKPEGGMFLWMTLPEGFDTMELFEIALQEKVAFVPGQAFFVDNSGRNTMRLNFSNADESGIITGIQRLAKATITLLDQKSSRVTA